MADRDELLARALRSVDSVAKQEILPPDPYWLRPTPKREDFLRDASKVRPEAPLDRAQKEWVGPGATLSGAFALGQSGAAAYEAAQARNLGPAAQLAAETLFAAAVPMAPKRPRTPSKGQRMGIERYVEGLKHREGNEADVVDFNEYLQPTYPIPESILKMRTEEPNYKGKRALPENLPDPVKVAESPVTFKRLRKLAREGSIEGLDGRPVNPWYDPAPMYKMFVDHYGESYGPDMFDKYMGYLAATSPMTGVERNTIEALHALHRDLNGMPMSSLTTGELTGGAYKNKVDMLGSVASGEGLTSPGAPKVRNFWNNLRGAGQSPQYELVAQDGKIRPVLIQPPSTIDNIMAQAFNYRHEAPEPGIPGDPKRPVGPPYRRLQDVLHNVAEAEGLTDPDAQAAIWQAYQRQKERGAQAEAVWRNASAYSMPYAGTFNEVINRIGREKDQHPRQVLEDLLEGRAAPPNFFTVKEDGGAVNGYAEGGVPAPGGPPGPPQLPPQMQAKDSTAKMLVSEFGDYPMVLQEALYRDLMTPKKDGGGVDESAIRASYTDHELGYGRHPLDDDYAEWRDRASGERYADDLNTFEVTRAMHDMAGYRPGPRLTSNAEDRRLDGDRERAHHQFIADSIREDGPSYAENYGPLAGPDVPIESASAGPKRGIMDYLRQLYGR
jgi:hypothetical protein